jgi:hypothetical protein
MGLRDIFTNPSKFVFYGGAGYPTPNGLAGGVNGVDPLLTLKYGKDTPGGGASKQPFIVTPIPGASSTFNTNGLVIARSETDIERLSKFFTTTPGLLFIAKQNVLSQTNVRTQAANYNVPQIQPNNGPYLPTNTLAQVGLSAVGAHFNKQGLLPNGDFSPKYNSNEVIIGVTAKSTNRLVLLKDSKITNSISANPNTLISSLGTEILNYRGGPGSTLGVGSTSINFAKGIRTGINNPLYTDNRNQFYGILPGGANKVIVADPAKALETQKVYQNNTITQLVDFRAHLRKGIKNSNILSESPNYSTKNIETRVKLGDPGRRDKNIISYTAGAIINGATKAVALDQINAYPLYRSIDAEEVPTNDLVKFRIEAIDNDSPAFSTFIHFRAFIDSFSDNYTADWSSTQYIGRGEQFYTYDKFNRTINMSWTVAAQSKDELIPMYQKLNFLASNLMPDYSKDGYMRGSLVRLTVGGYLYSQPGFITSLTYDIPQESPWEIGINDKGGSDNFVKELPHMIKVTGFTFTPIHNFVPRKQINTYGAYDDSVSTFGPERFIALAAGTPKNKNQNNYDPEGNNYTRPTLKELINFVPPPIVPDPNEEFNLTELP